ncbi:unnamed protein product [Cyprideis torosa]|uniref:Uncharacterized protein n=1 Tax=Cyprideis torosa TaxID=163714 RepID=A0A7R8ZP02_9CRUS|nr:unnamed protein product [Cyprideis torosa]CAG0888763.1 unnamed protein product [Cyprideis torosa]
MSDLDKILLASPSSDAKGGSNEDSVYERQGRILLVAYQGQSWGSHGHLIHKIGEILSKRGHLVTVLQVEPPPSVGRSNGLRTPGVEVLEVSAHTDSIGERLSVFLYEGSAVLCRAFSNRTFLHQLLQRDFTLGIIEDSWNHCVQHFLLKNRVPIINYYASVGSQRRAIMLEPLLENFEGWLFSRGNQNFLEKLFWRYVDVATALIYSIGNSLEEFVFDSFLVDSSVCLDHNNRPFLIRRAPVHFLAFDPKPQAIACFKCVSRNGDNPACEDPFHNNYTEDLLQSPCMGGRKGRNGLFPATACIKLAGYYLDTEEFFVIRTCEVDSGTVTLDTELVRQSHCGSFIYDGRWVTIPSQRNKATGDQIRPAKMNGYW